MEKDMNQYLSKAEVLIEALPYIQRFNRKIIVIKYGGSAMMNDELKKNVIADAVLLKLVGFKPIIVHGGGKEISRWVNKVGMEARFVNGLRVTDAPTMEIAEMVLNKVNKSLVQMVQELGVKVPEQVSVMGIDGTGTRKYLSPTLTTINMFPQKQGQECANILIDMIEKTNKRYMVHIKPKLQLGESVKNLRV